MEVYLEVVAEFPEWALQRAVGLWLHGVGLSGNENFAFPPSPAQLAIYCRDRWQEVVAVRASVRALLAVENRQEMGSAERARVAEKMARLSKYQKHLAGLRDLHLKGSGKAGLEGLTFPTFDQFCEGLEK